MDILFVMVLIFSILPFVCLYFSQQRIVTNKQVMDETFVKTKKIIDDHYSKK
jgi:hypothetical protein